MSVPTAWATSVTSAPVISQMADIALILEIRWARKALAAYIRNKRLLLGTPVYIERILKMKYMDETRNQPAIKIINWETKNDFVTSTLHTGVINRNKNGRRLNRQHYNYVYTTALILSDQPMSNQILNNILIYCWYNHSLKHNARTRQPKVSKKNHIQVT